MTMRIIEGEKGEIIPDEEEGIEEKSRLGGLKEVSEASACLSLSPSLI